MARICETPTSAKNATYGTEGSPKVALRNAAWCACMSRNRPLLSSPENVKGTSDSNVRVNASGGGANMPGLDAWYARVSSSRR